MKIMDISIKLSENVFLTSIFMAVGNTTIAALSKGKQRYEWQRMNEYILGYIFPLDNKKLPLCCTEFKDIVSNLENNKLRKQA